MLDTAPPQSLAARRGWLIGGFVLAFAATGAIHWPLAYNEVSLPNSLFQPLILVVPIAAFLARIKGHTRFLITTIVVGLGVTAAIAVRVAVDTTNDPTSHNLWPFELFLGGFVGHACAAVGSLIALPWMRKGKD